MGDIYEVIKDKKFRNIIECGGHLGTDTIKLCNLFDEGTVYCIEANKQLYENLKKINSLNIIGNPQNKAGVISFTIKGIHPHDISTIVDEEGVAIRAGHHCCQILHQKLNLSATARASIGIYNTKEDIDVLCKAIENCRKVFELK